MMKKGNSNGYMSIFFCFYFFARCYILLFSINRTTTWTHLPFFFCILNIFFKQTMCLFFSRILLFFCCWIFYFANVVFCYCWWYFYTMNFTKTYNLVKGICAFLFHFIFFLYYVQSECTKSSKPHHIKIVFFDFYLSRNNKIKMINLYILW